MKETLNLVLGALVVVVAVIVALVLVAKTWATGSGLDAQWGLFLALVFGIVLRGMWPSSENNTGAASANEKKDGLADENSG